MQVKKSGKAPYTKYNKAPYIYSEPYQQWKAAALRNDKAQMNIQAQRHNRMFNLYI